MSRSADGLLETCSFAGEIGFSEMRLPLTLSTAGHAIVFALLILLVAEPPPPKPAVTGGIQVVLGQSLSQPQPVVAPEAVSRTADPSIVAGLPPWEVAEPESAVASA